MASKKPTLASKRPELAAEWDKVANAAAHKKDPKHPRTPEEVTVSSGKKVFWRSCKSTTKCEGHKWQATVTNRSKGTGCSVCRGLTIQVGENDLASKRPELAAEWDYEANAEAHKKDPKHPRTPEEVTVSSRKKVHWLSCNSTTKCAGHKWQAAVCSRSAGTGCSVCRSLPVQAGVNDLATVHPELAAEWDYEANAEAHKKDPKHPRTPEEVTVSSHKKVHWLSCNSTTKCEGHKWEAYVHNRSAGDGCSACNGKTVQDGFNDLATVHPELAEEWDYEANAEAYKKNSEHPQTPQEVTFSSNKRVHWQCSNNSCGNKWTVTVNNRSRGRGCSRCANTGGGGFKDSEPACLYVIESIPEGETELEDKPSFRLPIPCVKFGISNAANVESRLKNHSAIFDSFEGVGIFGPGKDIRKIEGLLKKDKGKLVKDLGYRLWKETEEYKNAKPGRKGRDFDGYSETLAIKQDAKGSNESLQDLLTEILEQPEVEKILVQPEVQAFMKDYELALKDRLRTEDGFRVKVVDLSLKTIKYYLGSCQEAKAEEDSGLAEAA